MLSILHVFSVEEILSKLTDPGAKLSLFLADKLMCTCVIYHFKASWFSLPSRVKKIQIFINILSAYSKSSLEETLNILFPGNHS